MMFALESANHRPSVETISLAEVSSFKIGGRASVIRISKKEDIKDAVAKANENGAPIFILGGGSNVLFPDSGIDAVVIKVENKGIKEDEEGVVTAEAGEEWDSFVAWTLSHGYYGLENLSGIPGTVGGAPIQNIGAYGVEVKDLIKSVEVFDIKNSRIRVLPNAECHFGYRTSLFKTEAGKRYIVTAVTFRLSTTPKIKIDYKDLTQYFSNNQDPTPQEVRDAVIKIRGGKFPDLSTHGTAGSFFKNIICEASLADGLKDKYPDIPVFDAGGDKNKISTAYILDKICGLRDFRRGNVGLYTNQTLVVVNYGGATSLEVRNFIAEIKLIVKEKTGIDLEEEVVILT